MINAPVLHVNGDYPEGRVSAFLLSPGSLRSTDVERAVDIAFQYRHHFRKDVIIDLLVYRCWRVLIYFSLSGFAETDVNSTLIGATMSLTSRHLHNL
jgi:hypothetical protein